jgi:hypothetical protein
MGRVMSAASIQQIASMDSTGGTQVRAVIIYKGGPRHEARQLKSYVKRANMESVGMWHGRIAKQHFQTGASTRYGYRQRSGSYIARKVRVKGHRLPLVWSGRTRRSVLQSIRITGTSKSATGKMRANVLNFNRLYDEIVRVTKSEATTMARFHGRVIGQKLNAVKKIEIRRY